MILRNVQNSSSTGGVPFWMRRECVNLRDPCRGGGYCNTRPQEKGWFLSRFTCLSYLYIYILYIYISYKLHHIDSYTMYTYTRVYINMYTYARKLEVAWELRWISSPFVAQFSRPKVVSLDSPAARQMKDACLVPHQAIMGKMMITLWETNIAMENHHF